jgi:hypothetical protein
MGWCTSGISSAADVNIRHALDRLDESYVVISGSLAQDDSIQVVQTAQVVMGGKNCSQKWIFP